MLLLLLLCWPAQAETVLTLDGIVCGSQFLDRKVNHPVGGEFNRSSGENGHSLYDDLYEPTHLETDTQGRIIVVRGATLSLNGQVLARLGQPEAEVRERCQRRGMTFLPDRGGRRVRIVPTACGRVAVSLGFSGGKLTDLELTLLPTEAR